MKKNQNPLPPEFVQYLTLLVQTGRFPNIRRLRDGLIFRWALWQSGHNSNAIPGYATCPPAGPRERPVGWSYAAFRTIARQAQIEAGMVRPRSRRIIRMFA